MNTQTSMNWILCFTAKHKAFTDWFCISSQVNQKSQSQKCDFQIKGFFLSNIFWHSKDYGSELRNIFIRDLCTIAPTIQMYTVWSPKWQQISNIIFQTIRYCFFCFCEHNSLQDNKVITGKVQKMQHLPLHYSSCSQWGWISPVRIWCFGLQEKNKNNWVFGAENTVIDRN